MWLTNVEVEATFADHTSQWVWAKIKDEGWKRIKDGSADGSTNLFIIMTSAVANNRNVHVEIDGEDLIATGYLI